MYIFIFDANVPWDLGQKVKRLDEMMSIMNNTNFKIYISSINFYEMPRDIQEKIRKHKHIIIDETDNDELSGFIIEMHKKEIYLKDEDFAVLYTSHKFDATHIISSDMQVLLMTEEYAKCCNKKVKPFHLLHMFGLLHKNRLINYNLCTKMSLSLYKNKEIPQMIEDYGGELIYDKTKRKYWIKRELGEDGPIEKFKIYEKNIMDNLN